MRAGRRDRRRGGRFGYIGAISPWRTPGHPRRGNLRHLDTRRRGQSRGNCWPVSCPGLPKYFARFRQHAEGPRGRQRSTTSPQGTRERIRTRGGGTRSGPSQSMGGHAIRRSGRRFGSPCGQRAELAGRPSVEFPFTASRSGAGGPIQVWRVQEDRRRRYNEHQSPSHPYPGVRVGTQAAVASDLRHHSADVPTDLIQVETRRADEGQSETDTSQHTSRREPRFTATRDR